jgi:hypothetical protein
MANDPFIGKIKVNQDTGERSMWMGAKGGFVAVDKNGIPLSKRYTPEVQTAIDQTQSGYQKTQNLVPDALQFQKLNRNQGTGGWFDMPGQDGRSFSMMFSPQETSSNLQTMQGITNRMVRSQIVPGTSGTMNTVPEANMARSTFPSIQTGGPANDQLVRNIKIDRDIQLERLQKLQTWAEQGGTDIAQFERMWSPYEQQRRSKLQSYYTDPSQWPKQESPSAKGVQKLSDKELLERLKGGR